MEISIETKNRIIEATKPVLKQAIDVYNLYGLVTVANQRKDSCSCKNCMAIPNATRDVLLIRVSIQIANKPKALPITSKELPKAGRWSAVKIVPMICKTNFTENAEKTTIANNDSSFL